MKAITYSHYGPPEVLQLEDVDKPVPKDNEILIRIHATEATKADCEIRKCKFAVKWIWLPMRFALGLVRPRRRIPGSYFAGRVASVGRDVTGFCQGDEVFGATGLRLGTYGEYVALPATSTIVAKPRNMSFAAAAAVPLGGLNALHFLRLADIEEGESVLINGAGGSIGAHAIQIAKAMGAQVTAVDNAFKESLVRRFGADHFIDYTKDDFAATGQTYDVIFDMVPSSSYSACIHALRPNGRYLAGNPRLAVMWRSFWTTRFSNKTARFAFAAETREELQTLRDMTEAGTIVSIVDKVYPMSQASEAHLMVETEQRIGAIVIAIGGDG